MSEEWKKYRTVPAGDGRSTYVLHKSGSNFYWYKHFHDPASGKTKAVREDPPGMDLTGMPYNPPSIEAIEAWKAQRIEQVLEKEEPEFPVPLPEEITKEIDLVIEKLDERMPVLTRSKRPKDVRVLQEAKELLEKIKQAL